MIFYLRSFSPGYGSQTGPSSDAAPEILTEKTIMEIYPHTGSLFHKVMGILAALFIFPGMLLLFPVLVMVKFVASLLFYYPFSRWVRKTPTQTLLKLKNLIFFPFHHLIYKIFYVHGGIWLSALNVFRMDDYWYGLDLSKYQDIDDYMASFGNSKIRWKYRKNLKFYQDQAVEKHPVPDHLCFMKLLCSFQVLKLVVEASYRKNIRYTMPAVIFFCIRDYYLLLFMPLRVTMYRKNGKLAGLVTYLKRGNTLIMCQNIISDTHTGSALFYDQVYALFEYGFHDPDIRYLSCAATTQKAKKACGFAPIDFLLTDEYRLLPFSVMNPSDPSKERSPSSRFFSEEIKTV